jgi:hypothetical protein
MIKFEARKNPDALVKIRKLVKRPAHILLDDGHYLKKSLLDDEITAADLQNNHQRGRRPH